MILFNKMSIRLSSSNFSRIKNHSPANIADKIADQIVLTSISAHLSARFAALGDAITAFAGAGNFTAFFHGGDLKGLTGTCAAGDNGLIGTTTLPVTGATGTAKAGDRLMIAGVRRPLIVAADFSSASGNIH